MRYFLGTIVLLLCTTGAFGINLNYSCYNKDYIFECNEYQGILTCYQCSEIYRTYNGLRIRKNLLSCDCANLLIRIDRDCTRLSSGGLQ